MANPVICRSICRDRCAESGDPPCWELDTDRGEIWTPCADCLRDAGCEVVEPIDPNAVIRDLI